MKIKNFGKKCICGHFESQHKAIERDNTIPKISHDLASLLPHSPSFGKPKRDSCTICECKLFENNDNGYKRIFKK